MFGGYKHAESFSNSEEAASPSSTRLRSLLTFAK
jgi:hypothetical protein